MAFYLFLLFRYQVRIPLLCEDHRLYLLPCKVI
nr:MAG TPA: hypothetical protein [Bacteriophage sp.]